MDCGQFNERQVDEMVAEVNQSELPGVSIGIAANGRVVYRKGLGRANLEVPSVLTPSTGMRVFSVTKQFTCLLYLLLCEEGRARIDASVGSFLPHLHPTACRVTVQQIMSNTSGLRDVNDITWQLEGYGRQATTSQLVEMYRHIVDVEFQPGTSWRYNNGGFQILTLIIEQITGQRLSDLLSKRIFEPIGMIDSFLRPWDTDFTNNCASLHMASPTGFDRSYLGGELAGDGGVVSTVDDMLRWLRHMDSPVVGKVETWALMRSPNMLPGNVSTGYGLGLRLGRYRGLDAIYHSGAGLGGSAQVTKVPDAQLDLVVISNRSDVTATSISSRILDALLAHTGETQTTGRDQTLDGVFASLQSGVVIELETRGQRPVASINGTSIQLEWTHDGRLVASGSWADRRIAIDLIGDPANPRAILFEEFGLTEELKRMLTLDAPRMNEILGQWGASNIDSSMTVKQSSDGLELESRGQFGSTRYQLEGRAQGVWRTKPNRFGIAIVFLLQDSKELLVSTFHTRHLKFRRLSRRSILRARREGA